MIEFPKSLISSSKHSDSPEKSEEERIEELEFLGFACVSPGVIKIEMESPLEIGLEGVYLVLGVVFLCLSRAASVLPFFWLFITFPLIVFWILFETTDNFYLLDLKQRLILYHFKCFTIKREKIYAHFEEVAGITVTGNIMGFPFRKYLRDMKRGGSNSNWYSTGEQPPQIDKSPEGIWEYTVVLVFKDGNFAQIGDPQIDSHVVANRKAQLIADLMNCSFVPCPPYGMLNIVGGFDGKKASIIHLVYEKSYSKHEKE